MSQMFCCAYPEQEVEREEQALDNGADVVPRRHPGYASNGTVCSVVLIHVELLAIAVTRTANITSVHRGIQ